MANGGEEVNSKSQSGNSPWNSVAALAGQFRKKAITLAGSVKDKTIEQLQQPVLNARRKEALEFFTNNKDALVSKPTILGYEPELSEQQQRIVEEFKKKSEGLWSSKFAEELCKASQPSYNIGGLRGTYYGNAWRFIKKYDMPVSIVLENEAFYNAMVASLERIGDGKLSEIYQTMSQTKEGAEKFQKDFINNKRYIYDLDSEMNAIIRNEPYDKEKISDLKVLKQSGVCMLEGQDWSRYIDERNITRVSAGTEFLIQNNLFDGKEYGKVIADMLRNPRSTGESGFNIMSIASKAHIVPEGESTDIRYWSQALVESGENKLEVLLRGNFQKQLEKLNFSDEPVMRLFSRIHMEDDYRVAVIEVESWVQSPEFQEALKQTAIQETIMGEIEHQMKNETMHSERPPAPFLMLASDRDILEDMRRRESFDNYPESISKNDTIRKASKNDFTEKDRLELYSGHEYSDFFDNQGEPNNYWYHRVARDPSTSPPHSILSEHEKKRISLFEKMQNKALAFINQGSEAMSTSFYNNVQLRYWQFFDESGNLKPEFYQYALRQGDYNFLATQDKEETGFDDATNGFLQTYDVVSSSGIVKETRTQEERREIISKYFDVSGPKPEFWQTSFDTGDIAFLIKQDEDTRNKMGLDDVSGNLLTAYINAKNPKKEKSFNDFIMDASELSKEQRRQQGISEASDALLDSILNLSEESTVLYSDRSNNIVSLFDKASGLPKPEFWQLCLEAGDFSLLAKQDRNFRARVIGFDETINTFLDQYKKIEGSRILEKAKTDDRVREAIDRYFTPNGPKPEFWQDSLTVKNFSLLARQDEETRKSMGFDGATMAFLDGYAGRVFTSERRIIDESNVIQALTWFINKDAGDWHDSSEDDLLIREAFRSNSAKDLSLVKLRSLYERYLKNSNNMQFPPALRAMADYMHSKGGAGPLTQIEAFLDYAGALGNSMQEAKKDDDWRNELITNVATIEGMMQKYRWDNQEKSNFYATSAEIINASPELFQEFTQLFVNNLSKEEFKAFTGEIYPLYRAKLALLREYEDHSNGIGEGYTTIKYNPSDIDNLKNQLHTALLPFNCKEVSIEKRRKGIERVKENLFGEISELFKTKFSIRPEAIPSELSKADARVVGDMTLYLGSLAGPNQQKKDILGFYLALQLDKDKTAWEKLRSGDDVLPSNYLDIASGFNVGQAIELSRRNNPITPESTRIDILERLAEFRRAMQNETVSMRFGNIQTVDLRLQNLRGNMEELIDPDLYPEGIDRQRVELLRELPSQKEFNKIIGTIQQRMMGKDIPLTDEGQLIMGRVEQILKDNDLEVNTNNIKQYFQTDMKTIQAPFKILESIDNYGAMDSIKELQRMLNPPDNVVQILEKLGEAPKPQSGVMALGEDLDFLENLMVKKANELTENETNALGEYLGSIRKKLTELDSIYGKVVENYNTMKKNGVHPSTLNQIKEIDKIISNEANQSVITTTCTNEMTTIIENMRACLSCTTKGINNDTNLTFGEGYKFYLYSRENASRNSSVADEIVYFVPSEDEGGANKRLSFVMDRVYGMKNNDIMMAHIETMLKKAHELKSEFPEVPISVILPDSSIMSCSTSLDAAELSRRIGSGDSFKDIGDKTVIVPESGFGDHYIEFGHDQARVSGPRTVSGIEIVINPTADPQPAMVNNG